MRFMLVRLMCKPWKKEKYKISEKNVLFCFSRKLILFSLDYTLHNKTKDPNTHLNINTEVQQWVKNQSMCVLCEETQGLTQCTAVRAPLRTAYILITKPPLLSSTMLQYFSTLWIKDTLYYQVGQTAHISHCLYECACFMFLY